MEAVTSSNVTAHTTNNAVETELQKLMDADDAAQTEVDGWIQENQKFAAQGAPIPAAELNRRILKRFEPVRKSYEDFINTHPEHAKARVAYASFLDDIGDEEESQTQLEKALELDKTDPAIWNNLANIYGHDGEVTNAFAYYAKAIALNPKEPVYYQNLATTVYLFRVDAMEFYHITEPEVFDKALGLYADALKLDPTNFLLATDLAASYYGIRPLRTNDALMAWTNALSITSDETEREGVHTHLARVNAKVGRYDEARAHLNFVTNEMYAELKTRILKNIQYRETNSPADLTDIATNLPAVLLEPKNSTNASGVAK